MTHVPQRQVSAEEGERLAKENHAAWVETSAKSNFNVGEQSSAAFYSVTRLKP